MEKVSLQNKRMKPPWLLGHFKSQTQNKKITSFTNLQENHIPLWQKPPAFFGGGIQHPTPGFDIGIGMEWSGFSHLQEAEVTTQTQLF